MRVHALTLTIAALAMAPPVFASQAYGSLNNFDVVNDNETECHGFEIEIEDIHSRDITYTYDWNHYGAPRIVEDNSDPLHPIVRIYYEAKKNSDGSWSAYTAVPVGTVSPTDGHQFIDPSVNFGGEHFGVGFYGVPGTVRYFWLLDDGAGNLVRGNPVNIATPTFVYYPPVGVNPGQVAAAIEPPEPPEVPVREFGEATWVRVTTTETHNDRRVELRDLVSDDPDDDEDRNWTNGEPDEVEIEWQLLQTEFKHADGGNNGVIENAPKELPDGDEVITVRYDFFEYTGPFDPESYEALCESVGPDGVHGEGIDEDEEGNVIDFSTIEVVGDYIGAQMAGFDVAGQMGLIDHVQDAELYTPYVERRIVIDGVAPVVTTINGELPEGMEFEPVEGILSGTPMTAGNFVFTIHSVDSAGADLNKEYQLKVVDPELIEGEGSIEGVLEGAFEGSIEGALEGSFEGTFEGTIEGAIEGSLEGSIEGSIEGSLEGSVEGAVEGSVEGNLEGSIEGAIEGAEEGSIEGSPEGSVEGSIEGAIEGTIEGSPEGSIEGSVEGSIEGSLEGSTEGTLEGEGPSDIEVLLDNFAVLEAGGNHTLDLTEVQVLLPATTSEDFAAFDSNDDGELTVAELLAAIGGNKLVHSSDTDGDKVLSLGELIRVIQLYNAGGYTCLPLVGDSEDGYTPTPGDVLDCALPHAADYEQGSDGVIGLSELLRIIQFFTTGGYTYCPDLVTEDGYCPN